MKLECALTGYAMIDESGILTPGGLSGWQEGQHNAADVRRDQVYDQPLPAFGKLLLSEKLAFGVSSLILNHREDLAGDTTGVCLASRFGSLSTDLRFAASIAEGFPRPAWFSATLPSSPVAEAAIHYGLKGPNRVLCGAGAAPDALLQAALACTTGRATAMLVVYIEALERMESATGVLLEPAQQPCAFAAGLLLSAHCAPSGTPGKITITDGSGHTAGLEADAGLSRSYFKEILHTLQAQDRRPYAVWHATPNLTITAE